MSSSKTAGQAGHIEEVTAVPLRKLIATLLAISFGTILECECSSLHVPDQATPDTLHVMLPTHCDPCACVHAGYDYSVG
jgi:hypothetical protein